MRLLAFLTSILAYAPSAVWSELCVSESRIYTVVLDIFASELGYFTFKECPGVTNPTIGVEIGETYIFDQEDITNWYHPMGFAYFPDGEHDDKDELEPAVTQTGSDCVTTNTCPSPRYFRNGSFLGDPADPADFGLDLYEPEFFHGLVEWKNLGVHTIELNFDDSEYKQDIFYFCHIHEFMAGRIKLLKDGKPVSSVDVPEFKYEYDVPGEFDSTCGTFGLDPYVLPHPECLSRFVCTEGTADQFAACIDAMNCAMMVGMTTGYESNDPIALFIHQMVPHHQNAVNMAKALLNDGSVACADVTDEEDPDCQLEVVLRDIINTQNFQIQTMSGILEAKNYPETKDCVIEVSTTTERVIEDVPEEEKDETETDASKSVNEPTVRNSGSTKSSPTLLYAFLVLSLVKFFL